MTKSTAVVQRDASKSNVDTLFRMLRCRRPHGTDSEADFIKEFLTPLGVEFDTYGNAYKEIGTSPIVYSSHVDTVHDQQGVQMLRMDKEHVIQLHPNSKSNCLGADDTAGVWLMRELILAKRPGLYVFHRGEEKGCLGSTYLVKHTPELVKNKGCVIALDRRGYDSVITRQWGGRCCSDTFAASLAKVMGHKYKGDDGGSVTDSAHYTDLVGECTNLSVGYLAQHSSNESLHLPHLLYVRQRLLALEDNALTFTRKPGDKDGRYSSYNGGNYRKVSYGGDGNETYDYTYRVAPEYYGGYWVDNSWRNCTEAEWKIERKKYLEHLIAKRNATSKVASTVSKTSVPTVKTDVTTSTVLSLTYGYPQVVAKMLEDWGFDADMLLLCMRDYGNSSFKHMHPKLYGTQDNEKKSGDTTVTPMH